MTSTITQAGVATLLLLFLASFAAAQSLGDVARREEERRKTTAKAGKVYTNANLDKQPPPASAPNAAPAPVESAPQDPGAPPAGAKSKEPAEKLKDPEAWRKRTTAAKESLSRSQIFADALQSRINALTTDFVNRDDPAQQGSIAAQRDQAMAELNRVKGEIQQTQKEISDIQEEARRAGVPPGWLR